MTADHFAVTASELTAGASRVDRLSTDAETTANQLLESIGTLADAAGDAGLAGALRAAGGSAAASMSVLVSVLTGVSDTLTQNASTYERQEAKLTEVIRNVR
jgi:hypothetical protein